MTAMDEPISATTLAVAGLVTSAIGAAGAVASSISQMNAANAAAEYEKRAAAENARRLAVDARKQIGRMRANYGASGVTIEGSPLDVLEESARTAELDRLTILQGGQLAAAKYKAYGTNKLYSGTASGLLLGFEAVDRYFTDKLQPTG